MRQVELTIRAGALEEVLDRLLPLLPQGVHELPAAGGGIGLAVYDPAPPLAELEAAAGDALLSSAESEAPEDPAERRLRALARRPPIGGAVAVRPDGAPAPGDGVLDVVIEAPGGAFGSGTHPTTTMCLELLMALEPGGAFADLGCGTGVLAVTAALRGWRPVLAVDHEALGVEATLANARRNGVEVEALQADLLQIAPPPAPTVAANVPPAVHAHLAAALPGAVERVIASGIAADAAEGIAAAYERAGLAPVQAASARGWAAMLLVRGG